MEAGMRHIKLISAIVLLVSFYAFAEIDFRIGGGLNLSNELYTGDYELGDGFDKKMKVGFNAGVSAAFYFTRQLGMIAGVGYETRGCGWDYEDEIPSNSMSAEFSLSYLQIPVHFSYRPIPALAINLGPELGIFLTGESKLDGDTFDMDENINRIDFGASLTVDYTIANMIAVGAGYYIGFLDSDSRNFDNGRILHTNIKLFAAYVFHLKK
jgi:hypothetical protein